MTFRSNAKVAGRTAAVRTPHRLIHVKRPRGRCITFAYMEFNVIAYAIGLLLISAGVFEWTRRYRRGIATTKMPQPSPPDSGPNLMTIRWRSSFDCGHPVIDMQHRELFNISNELINSVLDRKPKIETEFMLHELIEHIKDHFSTEEDVLVRTRYPLLAEHRDIHRMLLERARDLQERYRTGLLAVSDLVGFIAYDVISTHIVKEDLKFALQDR
jgi:hemerythrin-like metal-binding protein